MFLDTNALPDYEQALQRLLYRSAILNIDAETARHYAAIRPELKAAQTPIPAHDAWIAATCRQYSRQPMSRDTRFEAVRGLRLRKW